MKRLVGPGAVALAIGVASVGALSAQSAKPNAIDKSGGKKQAVTLTGCLQGPVPTDEYALSLGPESARNAADAVVTFRLTEVTTKTSPAGGATYLIVGTDKQLSGQLGHQVQIVGTSVDRGARGTAGDQRAEPTADQYTGSSAGDKTSAPRTTEPTVRVESVRMISAKCTPRR